MNHLLPECRRHYAEVAVIVTKLLGGKIDTVLRVLDRVSMRCDEVQSLTLCNVPFYTAVEIVDHLDNQNPDKWEKEYEEYYEINKSPAWLEDVEQTDKMLAISYPSEEIMATHPPNTLAGLFERVDELIAESKKLLAENIQFRKENEALRSRLALMEKDQKCHSH